MNNKFLLLLSGGGAVDVQDTPLLLTCTTIGAATLTLALMNVTAGKTVVVDWGDGNTNSYTGTGARTHAYAGAGTYSVKLSNRRDITILSLTDTKISMTLDASNPLPSSLTVLSLVDTTGITYNASANPLPSTLISLTLVGMSGFVYNANTNPLPSGLTLLSIQSMGNFTYNMNTNPLPSGLTTLTLYNLSKITYNANTNPLPSGLTSLNIKAVDNFTYNANTNPLPSGLTLFVMGFQSGFTYNANTNAVPSGLTTLQFFTLPGLTWVINADQPWPAGATTMTVTACPGVTCTAWTDNAIRSIQAENAYSQADVDAFLLAIWTNKANFTYATPTLDLLGGSNSAPSGVYQAGSGGSGLPVTGKEYSYDLVNGTYTSAGPEWTVTTALNNITFLGDSITAQGSWPATIGTTYASGKNKVVNRGVGGYSIMANFDAQTAACANDNATYIIIGLGRNDNNGGDMGALQAEVESNVAALKISNPAATIYYWMVLPTWTDVGGGTVVDMSNIRTAITAACTAQSITCWDTFTSPWILASDTSDGTHLNASGNTKLANAMLALLPA